MVDETTRVLLVEDNAADARLLRELLAEVRERPFAVTAVGTLRDAIDSAPGHDVVLLDLSLPDAHGLPTIARMVENSGGIPVIVLTGNTDQQAALQAVTFGADDYLLKVEITPSLLARTILYALERRKSIEKTRQLLALDIARAESLRVAERARFLDQLSATFAMQLAPEDLARTVCSNVVPTLAELCVLDVVGAGEEVDVVFWQGAAEGQRASACRSESRGASSSAAARAIRERRPIDIGDVGALVGALENAPEDRLGQHEGKPAIVVPLIARGRAVGALTVTCRTNPSDVDTEWRPLVEEVACRAAVALDNVVLYRATERALRARDEMLAVVSHDLRNPLAVVALALHAIRDSLLSGRTPSDEIVTKGARAIARMERLLADLLEVALIDAGTFTVTKTRLELTAVLAEVIDQNAGLAAQKALRVEGQWADTVYVDADRHRVQQVVTNLLSNAIKFTPAGGTILVSCARRADLARVAVIDTGPGLSPEARAHVFDRFWQSERRRDGVGLGLAIAKGIVEAHGGRIGVETEFGCGASFWFEFPAAQAGKPSPAADESGRLQHAARDRDAGELRSADVPSQTSRSRQPSHGALDAVRAP